jgi:DNA-binding transcriptional MerR regulator
MTGLTVDTLRAWERRYEAVVPGRSDRGRRYSEHEVARLRRLAELVAQGHPISTIANLPDAELARLLDSADALATRTPRPVDVANLGPLSAALSRYDLESIEATLNRYAAVLPPRELVFSVVLPLLRDIGDRWERQALRPAQEHLVSAIVRSVLGSLLRTIGHPDATPKIVFATPAGERHELGLLCAAVLAASARFGVLYLGPDLPADDILHAATTTGAPIVMVSLTTPGAAARSEVKALTRLPASLELWVGGPEAHVLLSAAGDRARHVEALDQVVPMLSRYGR